MVLHPAIKVADFISIVRVGPIIIFFIRPSGDKWDEVRGARIFVYS